MSFRHLWKPQGPVPAFKYTPRHELYVMHEVKSCDGFDVLVVGLPNDGAYEWVLIGSDGQIARHSDCAYGASVWALRDGLVEAMPL